MRWRADRFCTPPSRRRVENREVIAFYQRIGFVQDAVVSLGKRLERDESP